MDKTAALLFLLVEITHTGTHTPLSHPTEAVEESNLGIAPRHEGQLCFSGKELEELSAPSSPFPACAACFTIPGFLPQHKRARLHILKS